MITAYSLHDNEHSMSTSFGTIYVKRYSSPAHRYVACNVRFVEIRFYNKYYVKPSVAVIVGN